MTSRTDEAADPSLAAATARQPIVLSARLFDAARLAARGLSDPEIAARLGIGVCAAKSRLGMVRQYLNSPSRADLVQRFAALAACGAVTAGKATVPAAAVAAAAESAAPAEAAGEAAGEGGDGAERGSPLRRLGYAVAASARTPGLRHLRVSVDLGPEAPLWRMLPRWGGPCGRPQRGGIWEFRRRVHAAARRDPATRAALLDLRGRVLLCAECPPQQIRAGACRVSVIASVVNALARYEDFAEDTARLTRAGGIEGDASEPLAIGDRVTWTEEAPAGSGTERLPVTVIRHGILADLDGEGNALVRSIGRYGRGYILEVAALTRVQQHATAAAAAADIENDTRTES